MFALVAFVIFMIGVGLILHAERRNSPGIGIMGALIICVGLAMVIVGGINV